MSKQFTLGKEERLKSRKQIEQLFSEGKKFSVAPFRIFYSFGNENKVPLQFGTGVSNKLFKKAADRNRIKRLVREAWRLQKINLQSALKEKKKQLDIFFIYTAKELPDYKEVYEKIGKSINKLSMLLNEIN